MRDIDNIILLHMSLFQKIKVYDLLTYQQIYKFKITWLLLYHQLSWKDIVPELVWSSKVKFEFGQWISFNWIRAWVYSCVRPLLVEIQAWETVEFVYITCVNGFSRDASFKRLMVKVVVFQNSLLGTLNSLACATSSRKFLTRVWGRAVALGPHCSLVFGRSMACAWSSKVAAPMGHNCICWSCGLLTVSGSCFWVHFGRILIKS